MLSPKVIPPVPVAVRLVIAVVPPIAAPKLIVEAPALTVNARAPLIVVVDPLKLMAPFVELRLIA